MRIGIDATTWTNWRGFGRFTRGIITTLVADGGHEYVLFFDSTYDRCPDVPRAASHVVVHTSASQSEAISVSGRRTTTDLLKMSLAVARHRLDVFFCPSIDSYFPLLRPSRRVVMIHDVIPETMGALMLPDEGARRRRALKVRTALRQCRVVATGSSRVAAQITDVLGVEAGRLAVVPYGVDAIFTPAASESERDAAREHVRHRHGIVAPFVVHVGGFGPNKNIPRLLDAFAEARRSHGDHLSLVFVGRHDADAVYGERAEIERRLASPPWDASVLRLGQQSDAELLALYRSAEALVLPSLAEGFGLPAVEAVSCGTPAIVTTESPLAETLGGAAIPVKPQDEAALAAAIVRVIGDQRRRIAAAGLAGAFGWRASAQAARAAFERAVL